jgi:hypothetical protein
MAKASDTRLLSFSANPGQCPVGVIRDRVEPVDLTYF